MFALIFVIFMLSAWWFFAFSGFCIVLVAGFRGGLASALGLCRRGGSFAQFNMLGLASKSETGVVKIALSSCARVTKSIHELLLLGCALFW